MDTPNEYTSLGSSKIMVSRMGIGIWSWGARFFWGYGKKYQENDLEEAFRIIVAERINFVDTAEVYGNGRSEKILGKFLRKHPDRMVIATKFFPFPWRIRSQGARRAIHLSLKRLGLSQIDLYQLHMPFPPYSNEFWLRKLVPLVQSGYIKAIGVSNFDLEQTKQAKELLENLGVPLISNQLRYSLLHREIERNGLLDYCKEKNISIIAYSPLGMGMLTGKYSTASPPHGIRQSAYKYTPEYLKKIQPILNLMREIGRSHGNKTISQVAINWTISKGTIPIPGVKNPRQALDNIKAIRWQLTPGDVDVLDKITEKTLGI
jgi:aryl-alcohol dehydrogenase-like predicted oxidoreductase